MLLEGLALGDKDLPQNQKGGCCPCMAGTGRRRWGWELAGLPRYCAPCRDRWGAEQSSDPAGAGEKRCGVSACGSLGGRTQPRREWRCECQSRGGGRALYGPSARSSPRRWAPPQSGKGRRSWRCGHSQVTPGYCRPPRPSGPCGTEAGRMASLLDLPIMHFRWYFFALVEKI